MRGGNGQWRQVGCSVLLTAAVAFPAGMWLARSAGPSPASPPSRAAPSSAADVRNPYSATIRSDPYVLARQRALVEAMENSCRGHDEMCAEARAARRYLDRLAGSQ
jgi:hypothetical protein